MNIRNQGRLAALMLSLSLFANPLPAADSQPRIVATIKPLQLLAMAVVGDTQGVDVLLDPRMSPHDYQLRPSDRSKLDRADIVFWIGSDMEVFMVPVLSSLGERIKIVSLQRETAAVGDPHLWMDPLLAAAMGHKMADALGKLAPTYSDAWHANAIRLESLLIAEDKHLRDQIAGIRQPRGYLVAHDAYQRFESRYGLRHRAALTDNADLPPSAQHIARIEAALNAGEISCVMSEPAAQPKVLQMLLKNRSVRTEVIDAMALEIPPGTHGIIDFYRKLGASMERCLQP